MYIVIHVYYMLYMYITTHLKDPWIEHPNSLFTSIFYFKQQPLVLL